MTREEFLERLGDLLACLPAEQIEESKAFYAEAIADRMEDGKSEEEAVAAIGSPGAVAEAILNDLPAVPRVIAKTRRRSNVLLWILAIVGSPLMVRARACLRRRGLHGLPLHLDPRTLRVDHRSGARGLRHRSARARHMRHRDWERPVRARHGGAGLGLMGGTLFVGAGAWAVTKQIARLSALWVNKALSPFSKHRGDGETGRPNGRAGRLPVNPSVDGGGDAERTAGGEHFSAAATAALN